MLFNATDKMHCGAPGVMRYRLKAPQRVDANDCCVGSQRSVRDRAQRGVAVVALELPQLRGAALKLSESFLGRHHGCAGRDGRHHPRRLGAIGRRDDFSRN